MLLLTSVFEDYDNHIRTIEMIVVTPKKNMTGVISVGSRDI